MAKAILKREEIPEQYTWNTADLYPSDDQWEADFQTLTENIRELVTYEGTLSQSGTTLSQFVTLEQEAGERLSKLMDYAQRKSDEDTRISTYQAMVSRISSQYVSFLQATAFEVPEVLRLPSETL